MHVTKYLASNCDITDGLYCRLRNFVDNWFGSAVRVHIFFTFNFHQFNFLTANIFAV